MTESNKKALEDDSSFSFLDGCSTSLKINESLGRCSDKKGETIALKGSISSLENTKKIPQCSHPKKDPSFFSDKVKYLGEPGFKFILDDDSEFNSSADNESLFEFLTTQTFSNETSVRRTYRESYIKQEDIDSCKPGSFFTFVTSGGGYAIWYFYRALNGKAYYIISTSSGQYEVHKLRK